MNGMFRQPTFWWVVGFCIAPAFIVWVSIVVSNELYAVCLESSCMARSMDLFSPVITLFQLGMGVLVLWTIAFRSNQTDTQIRELQRTNRFRDYLSHRELIFEILDHFEVDSMKFDRYGFYTQFFPDNSCESFGTELSESFYTAVRICNLIHRDLKVFSLPKSECDAEERGEYNLAEILHRVGGLRFFMSLTNGGETYYSAKAPNGTAIRVAIPDNIDEVLNLSYELLSAIKNCSTNYTDRDEIRLARPNDLYRESEEFKSIAKELQKTK